MIRAEVGMQVSHRDGKRGHVVGREVGAMVRVVWEDSTTGPAHPEDLSRFFWPPLVPGLLALLAWVLVMGVDVAVLRGW